MAKYLNNRVRNLKVGVDGKTDTENVLEVSGNVSATKFIGDGSGLDNVVADQAGIRLEENGSLVGTATTINFSTGIEVSTVSSGFATVTVPDVGFFSSNDTGIHTTGNIGIGTTTADGAADENNTTILNAGIVTAVNYYGKGVGLTSIVDAADGTYGSESAIPAFTITDGRITSIITNNVSAGGDGGQNSLIYISNNDSALGSAGTINFGSGINVSSPSAGVVTVTTSPSFFVSNDTGIHTTGNVGIGTTTADGAADENNTTVLNAGIVTANYFYGDATGLTSLTSASADTYGSADYTPVITVDANGRITGITTAAISGSGAIATIEEDTNPSLGNTLNAAGYGISNVGILTANHISISGLSTFHGNVGIGTTNAASDSAADPNNTTVLNAGIVTANYFYGDGTGLTGLQGAQFDAVSQDTDPELGGDLDLNNREIAGIGTINITGSLGGTTLKVGTGITAEAGVITATSFSFSNSATLTSSDSFVLTDDSGTPEIRADVLRITAADGTTNKMFFGASGTGHAVRLHHGGSEKLTTASNGIYVQGTVGSNGGADITGVVTATSFSGDGANITNVTSANATNASNIDLSDESTDTACFPIFATNATGNQAPKTDASNLLYNSSTGRLTAASFAGDGSSLTNVASIPGTFDENIEESRYISVNSGIGTNTDETNDIFVGPGTSFAFPSTAGRRYIIESIQITNKFSSDLYLSGRIDFDGVSDVPLAQRVIIPYQGSVEYLTKPLVVNPSDVLRLQSLAGVGTTASGISGGLDAFVTYTEKSNEDFVGIGTTAPSTSAVTVYESVTYPTVLESIKVSNYNLNFDIDASISIANVNTIGYLVYNLTIPKNTTIEIIEKPKHLATGHKIVAKSNTANSLAVIVSGKKIT